MRYEVFGPCDTKVQGPGESVKTRNKKSWAPANVMGEDT